MNTRAQYARFILSRKLPAPFPVLANDDSFSVKKRKQLANVLRLDELIREVRGHKVIFDTDLARIYGIPTFRLNEAVKRNRERFPDVPAYTCGGCGFEIA